VSDAVELFLLAVASAFWPTLILVDVLAFRLERPIRILVAFLAGALLTTIALGIVIVFVLQGSSLTSGSRSTFRPAVYLAGGAPALVAAWAVNRTSGRLHEPGRPSPAQRAVGGGIAVAFVAGIVLDIIPGVLPFVALAQIADLDASTGAKVVAIVAFYVVMFAFIEVPILVYAVAPARTTDAIARFNAWLDRNGRLLGAVVLAAAGVYLVVRGVVLVAT
jgi:predicted metal-binding membrane protein